MKQTSIFCALFAATISHRDHHKCVHDEILETLPTISRTEIKYANSPVFSHNSTLSRRAVPAYFPLRLNAEFSQLSEDLAANPTLLKYLTTQLIPTALAWYGSVLSTVPVSGNLKIARQCVNWWTNGKCQQYDDTCGGMPIPADHLDSAVICEKNALQVCLICCTGVF